MGWCVVHNNLWHVALQQFRFVVTVKCDLEYCDFWSGLLKVIKEKTVLSLVLREYFQLVENKEEHLKLKTKMSRFYWCNRRIKTLLFTCDLAMSSFILLYRKISSCQKGRTLIYFAALALTSSLPVDVFTQRYWGAMSKHLRPPAGACWWILVDASSGTDRQRETWEVFAGLDVCVTDELRTVRYDAWARSSCGLPALARMPHCIYTHIDWSHIATKKKKMSLLDSLTSSLGAQVRSWTLWHHW